MTDEFLNFQTSLVSPATAAETIVPSDTDELAYATRAVYVGSGGDVAAETVGGDVILLRNTQPGVIYPLRLVRVRATGTTAADLIGLR